MAANRRIQNVRGGHYLLTNVCGQWLMILNAGAIGNQLSKIRFKNKTTCLEYAFSYYLFELSQRCTGFRWIYVDLHWHTSNGVILPHFPPRPSLSFRLIPSVWLPFILYAVHIPYKWGQRQATTPTREEMAESDYHGRTRSACSRNGRMGLFRRGRHPWSDQTGWLGHDRNTMT